METRDWEVAHVTEEDFQSTEGDQRSSFLHNRPVTPDQQKTKQQLHGGDSIVRCDDLVFPDSTQATECLW